MLFNLFGIHATSPLGSKGSSRNVNRSRPNRPCAIFVHILCCFLSMCSKGSDNKGLKCTGCLVRIESKDQQRRGSFFRPRDLMLISIRGIWYQNSNKWLHMFSSAKTLPPLLHSLLTKMATWSYLPLELFSQVSLLVGFVCYCHLDFLFHKPDSREIFTLWYIAVVLKSPSHMDLSPFSPFPEPTHPIPSQRGLYRTVTLMMDTEHLNI